MKNIYLYGYSDDLCEVDSDFGVGAEFPLGSEGIKRIKINSLVFSFRFVSSWDIRSRGKRPRGWKLFKVDGLTHDVLIHLQIPDKDKVTLFEGIQKSRRNSFKEIRT